MHSKGTQITQIIKRLEQRGFSRPILALNQHNRTIQLHGVLRETTKIFELYVCQLQLFLFMIHWLVLRA